MDESFLDYLKRVTDEICEIQKNSAAESTARMDRFDEWPAKSSAEFDQRIRKNNEQIRKSREEVRHAFGLKHPIEYSRLEGC